MHRLELGRDWARFIYAHSLAVNLLMSWYDSVTVIVGIPDRSLMMHYCFPQTFSWASVTSKNLPPTGTVTSSGISPHVVKAPSSQVTAGYGIYWISYKICPKFLIKYCFSRSHCKVLHIGMISTTCLKHSLLEIRWGSAAAADFVVCGRSNPLSAGLCWLLSCSASCNVQYLGALQYAQKTPWHRVSKNHFNIFTITKCLQKLLNFECYI